MNDMSKVIVPKSDQINADDLISGPITITIKGVDIRPGTEQPVSIYFEGDNGKPWRPCKSMSRVLVSAWGPDAKAYIGRSVTLYRDPKVKWGGMEVGGIRVSHLSHIERDMVMALTATKGKRAPHTVMPLKQQQQRNSSPRQPSETPSQAGVAQQSVESEATDSAPQETLYAHETGGEEVPSPAAQALVIEDAIKAAETGADLAAVWKSNAELLRQLMADEPKLFAALNTKKDARKAEFAAAAENDITY